MFKPLLLVAVLVSLGIAAPPPAKEHAQPPASSSAGATSFAKLPAEAQAKAKSVYKIDCELCHGADGNGRSDLAESMHLTMGNWTDGKVLAGKSDEALFGMIRKGTDKMPPEPADRATDAQIRGLVLYIRSMAKENPDAIPAAAPAASGPSSMHP